jgi:hypothetical protein
MKLKTIALSAILILPAAAWSEAGKTSGTYAKHYYPIPQTESDGWAYQAPSCKALAQAQYAALKTAKKCQPLRKGIESCESEEKVALENMANGQKATFKLHYIVLNSLAACQRDREKYLQAGE